MRPGGAGAGLTIALAVAAVAGCSESGKPKPVAERAPGPADAGPPPPDQVIALELAGEPLGALAMERQVAIPLEEALARVPELAAVRSASTEDRVHLACTLARGSDPGAAMSAIRTALKGAASRLPPGAQPPQLRRRPTGHVRLAASSAQWTGEEMASAGEHIRRALQEVAGVAGVDSCGGGEAAVRVEIDPARLSAMGLDLGAIRSALGRGGPFPSIDDLSGAVIALLSTGARIALRDVARFERGLRAARCTARAGDGRPVCSIDVGLADAGGVGNAHAVADQIRAIAARLPGDVRIAPLAPAGGTVVELHADSTSISVESPESVAGRAAALARALASAPGVGSVVVESGDLATASESLTPFGMRALVGVEAGAAPARLVAAARSAGIAVRVAGGTAPIRIQGDDLELLQKTARAVAASLASARGVASVATSAAPSAPRVRVEPDRARLASAGVAPADVDVALAIVFGGAAVAELVEGGGGQRVPIRLAIEGATQGSAGGLGGAEQGKAAVEVLARLHVRRADGALVPLSTLTAVTATSEPVAILRHRRRRTIEIWLEPAEGTRLEQAMAAGRRAVEAAVRLPPGVDIAWPSRLAL